MSIYGQIVQLAQGEQDIRSQQALAGLHQAQTQQVQVQTQVDQATRDSMRQYMLAQQDAAAANQANNPLGPATPASPDQGVNNAPMPGETGPPAPGQQAPQPAGPNAGGPAAGGAQAPAHGLMATPEMQGYQQRMTASQNQYKLYRGLADAIRSGGGNLKTMQQYDDNASQALTQLNVEQAAMATARTNALKRISSLAGTVAPDGSNFAGVKAELDQELPGWDRGQNVDFDPLNGGQVTWGPRTAQVLKSLNASGQTAYEQAEVANDAIKAKLAADKLDVEKANNANLAAARDATSAMMRARAGYYDRGNQPKEPAGVATADAKAAAKAASATPKVPSVSEVRDLSDNVASDYSLPPAQANLMANDILSRRNEIMVRTPGTSIADATAQATQEAEARYTAPVAAKPGTLGFGGTPATPATYTRVGGKSNAPAAGTVGPPAGGAQSTPAASAPAQATETAPKGVAATVAPFTAAKIPVEFKDGKLTSNGGPVPVTSKALYEALPSGSRYTKPGDPPGSYRTKA